MYMYNVCTGTLYNDLYVHVQYKPESGTTVYAESNMYIHVHVHVYVFNVHVHIHVYVFNVHVHVH